MSCQQSCQKGDWSSLDHTWDKNSSLRPTTWDPYPELQGPDHASCNNVETYQSSNCNNCNNQDMASAYNLNRNLGPSPTMRLNNSGKIKESFTQNVSGCCANPYNNLGGVWKVQDPYSL